MGLTQIELAGSKAHGHDPAISVTSGAAVALLSRPNERARRAVIQVLTGDIYFRDDGGTPSSSYGQLIPAGDIYVYDGDATAMANFKAIAASATASVRVAWYGI